METRDKVFRYKMWRFLEETPKGEVTKLKLSQRYGYEYREPERMSAVKDLVDAGIATARILPTERSGPNPLIIELTEYGYGMKRLGSPGMVMREIEGLVERAQR